MRCETTADPATMWDLASGFLLADPVPNNVLVTNIAARRDGAVSDPAPATYAVVLDEAGRVVGAAMRTPPHAIVVSPMPAGAVPPLVEVLARACPDARGVGGPAREAEAFATAWSARTAGSVVLERRERMYRLDAVAMPAPPGGRLRLAERADRDLLVAWYREFEVEVGLPQSDDAPAEIEWRTADGRIFVWDDGGSVSFASASRPEGGVVRIGPVYTPPNRRGRGYASAMVAAMSQRALDAGAACCMLYTDLANPTSNRIYMNVGYRPVGDVSAYGFTSAGGTTAG
jgi:RimJ/RimL family protein N-acetyltransferase